MAQERNGGEAVGDRLKMMKLAFLAAYPLYWDRIKALNLRFYRYTWGPYTEQVSDSWDDLCARHLLGEEEMFYVTEEGERLARSFRDEVLGLSENQDIRRWLEDVVEAHAALDTQSLLSKVYDMYCYTLESPGRKHRIKSISQRQQFTAILEAEDADESLVIPPGWQITLELALDPDALRNLQRGIDDAGADRLYGWDALGADV